MMYTISQINRIFRIFLFLLFHWPVQSAAQILTIGVSTTYCPRFFLSVALGYLCLMTLQLLLLLLSYRARRLIYALLLLLLLVDKQSKTPLLGG